MPLKGVSPAISVAGGGGSSSTGGGASALLLGEVVGWFSGHAIGQLTSFGSGSDTTFYSIGSCTPVVYLNTDGWYLFTWWTTGDPGTYEVITNLNGTDMDSYTRQTLVGAGPNNEYHMATALAVCSSGANVYPEYWTLSGTPPLTTVWLAVTYVAPR